MEVHEHIFKFWGVYCDYTDYALSQGTAFNEILTISDLELEQMFTISYAVWIPPGPLSELRELIFKYHVHKCRYNIKLYRNMYYLNILTYAQIKIQASVF